ncbi:hypothetical protein CDAR_4261, partial [Caerostris darwini]
FVRGLCLHFINTEQ